MKMRFQNSIMEVNMSSSLDFEYLYKNREEAYRELFNHIDVDNLVNNWIIVTTTLNNIEFIDELSKKLDLEYEPFFLEEITAPNNDECVIATVSELKDIVIEKNLVRSFEIEEDWIYKEAEEIYNKNILTKLFAFKMGKTIENIDGKNIMIFSDGCDIGLNIMCAVKSFLNYKAKKIFLYMPIISQDLYHSLDMIVDEIFVNHKIADFIRTSYYFENFDDIDLDKVRYILENKRRKVEQTN